MLSIIKKRYSCRDYEERDVSRELIDILIEALRLAPSACNKQPWRLAIVKDFEIRRKLIKEGCLYGINMDWAINAPVIVVLGVKKSLITHIVAPKISNVDYSLIDIGIAGEHLVLQATELGLQSCWIGWIKPKVVAKLVGFSKDIKPKALITIGYPKEKDRKEKERLKVEEIVKFL